MLFPQAKAIIFPQAKAIISIYRKFPQINSQNITYGGGTKLWKFWKASPRRYFILLKVFPLVLIEAKRKSLPAVLIQKPSREIESLLAWRKTLFLSGRVTRGVDNCLPLLGRVAHCADNCFPLRGEWRMRRERISFDGNIIKSLPTQRRKI